MPVSEIRTKVRQEFERQRYVNQLPVADMLLFQSHSEYQVGMFPATSGSEGLLGSKNLLEVMELRAQADMNGVTALGDVKLLETTTARVEVFSGEGESYSKTTAKFHARLFG
ncbi:MAG: hypothetical protein Q9186_007466, partial [Xanthomendoza sp. 1 TL-2023]